MRVYFFLFVILTLFSSCKKDKIDDSHDWGSLLNLSLPAQDNDQIAICYDIITAQHVEARNPADTINLSFTDKVFHAPEYMGAYVEMIVRENGEIDANIQKKHFSEIPVYPENRLNNTSLPFEHEIDRIELRGSSVNCFNGNGQIIGSGSMNPIILNMIESAGDIEEAVSFSQEEVDVIVQAFEEAGMNMHETVMDGVYLYDQLLENGERVKILFDMERGVQIGQASYKPNGEMDSKSNMFYDETEDGKLVVSGHRFVTYMESPVTGVELAIIQRSRITNFQMQTK